MSRVIWFFMLILICDIVQASDKSHDGANAVSAFSVSAFGISPLSSDTHSSNVAVASSCITGDEGVVSLSSHSSGRRRDRGESFDSAFDGTCTDHAAWLMSHGEEVAGKMKEKIIRGGVFSDCVEEAVLEYQGYVEANEVMSGLCEVSMQDALDLIDKERLSLAKKRFDYNVLFASALLRKIRSRERAF